MTELSPMDDKFVVYVQKSCNPGPYLDPSKVTKLPDFFQEKSTVQTITNVIEAVILSGSNFKETLDKVPAYLGPPLKGVDIEVTEYEKDGQRKKHHYRLPKVDRKSKGEIILYKLVENLMCCSKFLSCDQSTCKECPAKQGEFTSLNIEPTTELPKKEPTTCSPKMPKYKHHLTVYCRRNCKVGPLLDPDKIKKLPTSFSGSLPKIIQSLVPAIVLSGHNPNDAIKHVPSSQGRCILVNVKIGKLNQMCLVRSLSSSVKFWSFLRKFRSAFDMCENFFSEKPPRKSSCKKCRSPGAKADYYSSDDDDDFQDLKGYKDQTVKRKSIKKEPTPVKKSKLTEDSSQVKCKELKVVIEKLPQETVNNYLQRGSLPRTPTRNQIKQVYLHGKKVNVVVPRTEKSPRKSLFPEAPGLLLSPVEGRDDEADNLFNIGTTQENTQAECAEMSAEEVSIEKADNNDNYLLETFLDQGVENDNEEVMGLKEISIKMEEEEEEERNPLQGLFEKSDEQLDSSSSREEKLEDDESFKQYSSPFDAVELFSPGSFFGDVLGSTEVSSSSERIEMGEKKREQENEKSPSKDKEIQEITSSVDIEETSVLEKIPTQSDSANKADAMNVNKVEVQEEKMSGESETAVDNSAIAPVEATPITCTTPEFQPLGAEDFSLTASTSTICPAPQTPRPLNSVSGSGIASTQVPQQSLPGNHPDFGFLNVTFGMPSVSLPENSGANSSLPIKHDTDSILFPGKQPVSFPGNFCSNTSHPVSQGTVNTSSTSISSGALPGPNTNTSSLTTCTTNQRQFPQGDCRSVSTRPMTAIQKEVHNARQKANQILRQSRQQAQSFVPPHMNVGLGGPYSYQGMTNNFMANQVPQAGSHSLYSVQSPRYYPSNQASQSLSLDKHLQVPAARHNLPLTLSLLPAFGHTFMNTALPIRQPYSSTNKPSSLVTSQSIPCTTVLSGGVPATRYYASSAMGQIVSQSVPKTNPSTVMTPMTRNHRPSTCLQRNSYSVPNVSPSVPSMTQYHPLSTPFQVPSYSIPSTNPSTGVVQSNAWQYPGPASGNLVNQSFVTNFSPVGAFPSSYYPTSATRPSVSQSFVGTNLFPAAAPTTSCYPTSATTHPYSQTFVGTNLSSAVATTTSCYPTSAARHPVRYSFVGANFSAVAPTTSCYPTPEHQASQSLVGTNFSSAGALTSSGYSTLAPGHPVSQSLVGTNLSSVGALTSSGYSTSAPGHPVSQSLVGTNFSSVGALTSSGYSTSAPGHPVSQSLVGTNLSSVGALTSSGYSTSAPGHPVSQSLVGTNFSSVGALTSSGYSTSAPGHPVSQSLVGTNFSSVGALTSSGYSTSAPGHPVSQSLVGTNPSSSEIQAMIGQESQTLSLTSQSHDRGKIQASLNVPTTFAFLSSIQTSITTSISKSSSIPTASTTSTSNVDELEITPESSNNENNMNSYNNEAVAEILDPETQKLLKKNPLAKTTFDLLKRCEILPKEQGLHLRKKIEQMLWKCRQRLAITLKDINDLEEIFGAEIRKDVVFQELIKLITAEPVLKDSNGVYHSISNTENQAKQRNAAGTGQGTAMIQSFNGVGRNTSVMQSLGSGHMDVTPSVEPIDSDNRTEGSTSDDEVIIIEQSSQKSSIPKSGSCIVNNQPKNDISRNNKSNPSLPKPSLQVLKSQGITILFWDFPDQSLGELVKEYELYAIQLEANKEITEDLIRSMTWKKIGNVKALPPPMVITLTNLLGGFTNYMIIRGVDKDGCAGPFSSLCKVIGS